MTFDAFWLPGLSDPATLPHSGGGAGEKAAAVRLPALRPQDIRDQVVALIAAGDELQRLPGAAIVAAVDRVARRLLDRGDEVRRLAEDLVPSFAGYSAEMARLVLDRMASDWTAERLDLLLRAELGNAAVLDGFADVPGRPGTAHAIGPRFAVHIFSGNVPGVAVTSLIRTLLVKSPALGKTAAGEPILAPLFARALAEVSPVIGSAIAVAHWRGGDVAIEEAAFERAEAVIAYGSARTIESVRARVPGRARFLAHGSRVSFAVVGREALVDGESAEAVARDAALAVATFDQQGCVSPHQIFCEDGGAVSPAEWAGLLAGAMEALEAELPRGPISAEESSAIQQVRGAAEIADIAGKGVRLSASRGSTAWTVLYELDGAFRLSCLNRTVRVMPVATILEVPGLLTGVGDVLQTVGVAGGGDRADALARALARAGVSRIASLRESSWPPPWWHHDGRPPLVDLVRWCDRDTGA